MEVLTPEASVKSFYDFLKERKIMGTKCKKCGEIYLPPRPLCPKCVDSELEWVELEGRGKLAAFTSISVAPTHMLEAGHTRDNPYVFGLIELDSGPTVSALILGVDAKKPENIEIGTRMTVEFVERDDRVLLGFKPA
ncbi:MAG: Zn-ribbon domain-containing OB-fold protein [Candidatus Freyarchaeota archaeon]